MRCARKIPEDVAFNLRPQVWEGVKDELMRLDDKLQKAGLPAGEEGLLQAWRDTLVEVVQDA